MRPYVVLQHVEDLPGAGATWQEAGTVEAISPHEAISKVIERRDLRCDGRWCAISAYDWRDFCVKPRFDVDIALLPERKAA